MYIHSLDFFNGCGKEINFVSKILANLAVRKVFHGFVFLNTNNFCVHIFCNKVLFSKTHCFRVISLNITTQMSRFYQA